MWFVVGAGFVKNSSTPLVSTPVAEYCTRFREIRARRECCIWSIPKVDDTVLKVSAIAFVSIVVMGNLPLLCVCLNMCSLPTLVACRFF